MARNDGFDFIEVLDRRADGSTLLDHLVSRYPHSDRAAWSARLEAGEVEVDAMTGYASTLLRAGSTLVWRRPPWDEPEAPLAFGVLHEDEALLAIDKPSGLPTLPGAGFHRTTLLHQVQARFPDAVPIHRLGRFTSGIVVFARTGRARASLSDQLKRREITKRYRALLSGSPPWDAMTNETPIGPVPHDALGTVHAASVDGRPAESRFVVVERRDATTLCDVVLVTGRPHQIRIHAAAAGYPLAGDPLYPIGGVPERGTQFVPGDGGYALHAAQVELAHPATGMRLTIVSEPPLLLRAR